jgi:hypothetical protein
MYAIFDSLEVFTQWEANIKTLLGYPNDCGTINYTNPIGKVDEIRVIAYVTDDIDSTDLVKISTDQARADGWLQNTENTNNSFYYFWDEATKRFNATNAEHKITTD